MCNPSLSSVSFSDIYICTTLLGAVDDIVGPGSISICPKVRELEGAIPFMSPVIRIIKDRVSVMVIVSHPGNDEIGIGKIFHWFQQITGFFCFFIGKIVS